MSNKTTVKYVTAYSGLALENDLRGHTLIFTHVPKTAGTTLEYILRAAALAQRIPFRRALGTIYGQFHGVGKGDPLKKFTLWPDSALHERLYVSGHLPYGVHERVSRPYFYLTLLRDPLARLLSQFRYGVQRGGWNDTTPIVQVFEKGLMADNLQTRQIAGLADRNMPCTADTLKAAIDHLRSEYTLVGTTERFDDTLKLLITLLGWPDVVYGNRQLTAGAPSPQLMQQAQEATQRFFAYDLELYAVAREIVEQNVARALQGSLPGPQRQDRVLVCIPGSPVDGKESALISAQSFDQTFVPALRARGADIQFV